MGLGTEPLTLLPLNLKKGGIGTRRKDPSQPKTAPLTDASSFVWTKRGTGVDARRGILADGRRRVSVKVKK